ncbi:MAG: uroporphyrinogen-III C-methyltransferase [Alicyclobacillus sp.]|nr:uroporphyrinogen-III C-methyltransferase [Alicyclobacillus sp.]
MTQGKVWLVGAGPGDPGLLTTKGRACLQAADAVVYDRLVSPRLLGLARPDAALYDAGKSAGNHTRSQAEIEQLLVALAQRGQAVVRLKGGDPFVFGRGGEEAVALRAAGIPWEVVPGVTSAVAVPAYAGIPVTHRQVSPGFTVVTGHRAAEADAIEWRALAHSGNTLVILMGASQLTGLAAALLAGGMAPDTPVAVVRWGTRANQQTLVSSLARVATDAQRAGMTSPAVIVVGQVVSIRTALNWMETLPLFGQRCLVAADTCEEADRWAATLEAQGAEVFPVSVEHATVIDGAVLARWLRAAVDPHAGLYFSTSWTVRVFFRACRDGGLDLRRLRATFAAATSRVAKTLAAGGVVADGVGPRAIRCRPGLRWLAEEWGVGSPHPPASPIRPREIVPLLDVGRRWLTEGQVDRVLTTAAARCVWDELTRGHPAVEGAERIDLDTYPGTPFDLACVERAGG